MKRKILLLSLTAIGLLGIAIISCKKVPDSGNKLDLNGEKALVSNLCYEILPSEIRVSRTLDPDSAYLISGCVKITNGAILTAPAGTVFLGDHNTNSKGLLVVERGSRLVATGTSTDPVVFTSFQSMGSRQPGDWKGIAFLGQADNNSSAPSSKVINITKSCGTLVAGAVSGVINDAQNSGTLQYVRIEYAGFQASGEQDPASLLLAAVGSGTTIDHVQITESAKDGIVVRGGKVKATHMLSFKTKETDFRITNGYRENMQYWAAVKSNAVASSVGKLGLDISNDLGGSSNTPLTYPTISNFTFLGGEYCAGGDAQFAQSIIIQNNGNARIYNSVIAGYSSFGLVLSGDNVVQKTASGTDPLQFSYNSFDDVGGVGNPYSELNLSNTWTIVGGCDDGMTEWIEGVGTAPCMESGYQNGVSTLGYNLTNICSTNCSSPPDYALGTTTLLTPNFTWDSGSQFDHPAYRGAFGATSWVTSGWNNFCPLNTNYCF
jgi:hypothetical protein